MFGRGQIVGYNWTPFVYIFLQLISNLRTSFWERWLMDPYLRTLPILNILMQHFEMFPGAKSENIKLIHTEQFPYV